MKQNYVTAVLALLEEGMKPETVFANLASVLKTRGHFKLFPAVLRTLITEVTRAQKASVATVTLVKENGVAVSHIKEALQALSAPTEDYEVKFNPNIIGGLVVNFKSKQLDQSYQTKLRELYQSIITT